MKPIHHLLAYILLVTSLPVFAQSISNSDSLFQLLDRYLVSANTSYHFNGCALVSCKGKIILNKGYGFSNMSTQEVNTPGTRFPILSVGKTFTSAVILKLQEDGKLSLDDKLSTYFPDFPNGDKISIENLLTHTSGIHNFTDDVDIEDSANINHPIPQQRILDQIMSKPADFRPGARYSYNNSGYFLLGMIIEKITGKSYFNVVREKIFYPLQMNESGFDYLALPDSMKATGYQFWNDHEAVPYHFYDSTYAFSAGSIYSTTSDLCKYAQAISSDQILNANSWKNAFTPRLNHYGLGWMSGDFFGKKYIRHSGGYPGFMSEFVYYPEEDVFIILLNNFGTYGQNVWSTAMGVSCIMLGLPYDDWKLRSKADVDKKMLSRYEGAYFGENHLKLQIHLNDDRLFVSIPGEGDFILKAENESSFYFRDFNTQFYFKPDSNGKVTRLIVHEHGKDYEYLKKK